MYYHKEMYGMKIKKFVAVRDMKAYVGGGIFPPILNRGTKRR